MLFIDDEEPVHRAMRHVLRRFGCDAVEAAGSDEAVERTRSFVPELVLADCRLGDGDDGIAAVARLREAMTAALGQRLRSPALAAEPTAPAPLSQPRAH